jgi:hypothetical protein
VKVVGPETLPPSPGSSRGSDSSVHGLSCSPVKQASDTSLCSQTCAIMRKDDASRLANEFARSFLRRYEPLSLPPKQMELSLSA